MKSFLKFYFELSQYSKTQIDQLEFYEDCK